MSKRQRRYVIGEAVNGVLETLFSGRASRMSRPKLFWSARVEPLEARQLLSVPAAPSGLSGSPAYMGYDVINLSWADNSSNESGFKIDRSTDPTFANDLVTTTLNTQNQTTYAVTSGLVLGATYYFRVRAYNTDGDSASVASSAIRAYPAGPVPAEPTTVTATASSSSQINLAWQNGTSNPPLTTNRIDRSTSSDFTANFVRTDISGSASSYPVTGLSAGTTYYFRVTGINSFGWSNWVQTSTATQGAANHAPTDISLSTSSVPENQPSQTVVGTLSSTDSDSGDAFTYTLVAGTGSTDNSSFTIDGSQLKTAAVFDYETKSSYSIRIRTTDRGGLWCEKAFTISVTYVPIIPPATPSGFSAIIAYSHGSRHTYAWWTDNSSDESGFRIDVTSDPSFNSDLTTVTVPANSTEVPTIPLNTICGATYYFRLRAYKGSDLATATYSDATYSMTPDPAAGGGFQPAAPTGVSVAVTSPTHIDVNWQNGATTAPYAPVRTQIDRSTSSTLIADPNRGAVDFPGTTYAAAGLLPGTTYYFRVIAIGSWGWAYPVDVHATTWNAPTVATPASASPSPSYGTTTTLSVRGAYDGGEDRLAYTWATTGTPPAPVTFSANGTHGARDTTATFTKPGTYSFIVTIADPSSPGFSVTSTVSVTVVPALASVIVSPATASVEDGASKQFSATGFDQFGTLLSPQPTFAWSVDTGGLGAITPTGGNYTAPSTGTGSATVRASASGVSGTATVSVIPLQPPGAPTSLVGSSAGPSQAILNWTNAISNADIQVQYATDPGFVYDAATVNVPRIAGGAPSTATIGGLLSGVTYYFHVRASNSAGASAWSNRVAVQTYRTPQPPNSPTNPVLTALMPYLMKLDWTDPVNGTSPVNEETEFLVDRATDPDFLQNVVRFHVPKSAGGADVTTLKDSTVLAATTYYYHVFAVNAAGWSAPSAPASLATSGDTTPQHLKTQALSSTSISVTWQDVSHTELGYTVQVLDSSGNVVGSPAILPANSQAYVATGLSAQTSYRFRVTVNEPGGVNRSATSDLATTLSVSDIGWYRITLQPMTHGEAGMYPADGLYQTTSDWVYADSWQAAALKCIGGSMTTPDWDNEPGGTFPVLSAPDASGNRSLNAMFRLNESLAVRNGPTVGRCLSFEDIYGNSNCDYDYDDDYWLVTVEQSKAVLTATALFAGPVQLGWVRASSDAGMVERSSDGGTTWLPVAKTSTTSGSYIDSLVTPNTPYLYRIRSWSGADKWSSDPVPVTTNRKGGYTPLPPGSYGEGRYITYEISIPVTTDTTDNRQPGHAYPMWAQILSSSFSVAVLRNGVEYPSTLLAPAAGNWSVTVDASGNDVVKATVGFTPDDQGTFTIVGSVDQQESLYGGAVLKHTHGTANSALTVVNVAPTATLLVTFDTDGTVHISLSNPHDPSSVDTAMGFLYSFSFDDDVFGNADSDVVDSTSSVCPPPPHGAQYVWGRIKDKDGATTVYGPIPLDAPPAQVTGVSVEAPNPFEVNVSWTPVQNRNVSYEVQARLVGAAQWDLPVPTAAHASVWPMTKLYPGRQYEFRVRAVSPHGTTSAWTAPCLKTMPNDTTVWTSKGEASIDIGSDHIDWFSGAENGHSHTEQTLPAGYYRVVYIDGAMSYTGDEHQWSISDYLASDHGVEIKNGDYVISGPGTSEKYATAAEAKTASLGLATYFWHDGGGIGVYLYDDPYGDNDSSGTAPKFRLEAYPTVAHVSAMDADPSTTSEADPAAAFVSLVASGGDAGNVNVKYGVAGTASSDDYVGTISGGATGSINLPSNGHAQFLSAQAVPDDEDEGDESLDVIPLAGADYLLASVSEGEITITDKPAVMVTPPVGGGTGGGSGTGDPGGSDPGGDSTDGQPDAWVDLAVGGTGAWWWNTVNAPVGSNNGEQWYGSTDDGDGLATGGILRLNSDFDESGDWTGTGAPPRDYQKAGIVAGDDDLSPLGVRFWTDAQSMDGDWEITWDAGKVNVYVPKEQSDGTMTYEKVDSLSGRLSDLPHDNALWWWQYGTWAYVEAISPSSAVDDTMFTASFTPDDGDKVGDSVACTVYDVDLDVDSDNNNGTDLPGRTAQEDYIEDDATKPGKIVQVDDGDSDGDHIPDYADGYDYDEQQDASGLPTDDQSAGLKLVPMVVTVNPAVPLDQLAFSIQYDASDPDKVTTTGAGTASDPLVYHLPEEGTLRLWTRDGSVKRTSMSFNDVSSPASGTGYYIPPGAYTAGSWAKLAKACGQSESATTLTLYVEAVKANTGTNNKDITFYANIDRGDYGVWNAGSDTVRVTAVATEMAADNNRDGIIKLNTSDSTTSDRPYLFWLNTNHDVWGGSNYQAAESAPNTLSQPSDWEDDYIGSYRDVDGNSILGNATAMREVAERDLEDFAQLGLRWTTDMEDYVTGFRIRLDSESDPNMLIRLFVSARKSGLQDDEFSATSHVDDQPTIDEILTRNHWQHDLPDGDYPSISLGVGETYSWSTDNSDLNQYAVAGSSDSHLLQLMFEGCVEGSGRIVFELMHDNQVLTSSAVDLRLRPLSQLYDHYTVADDAAHVSADGTYRNDINPLNDPHPVRPTADLIGANGERGRILEQSKDYFLYVHGWRMQEWERVAFAESAYKRMFWSGYKGQFGFFDWPTQQISDPTSDTGNFDRSEFIAWNSAPGLLDALLTIRNTQLGPNGKLSVMAHSMGNVALSEALHSWEFMSQTTGHPLVDTAIMSQAAISSHYFTARTDRLQLIYRGGDVPANEYYHINSRVIEQFGPEWTLYKGFEGNGGNTDAIGGLTPRFDGIAVTAGRILNYYNPDDYALGTWKLDQAFKPLAIYSNPLTLWEIKGWLDLGSVTLPGPTLESFKAWLRGRDVPGFAGATYAINNAGDHYEIVRQVSGQSDVVLTYPANMYEMFAFGASSIVAPVGATDWTKIPGVFSDGVDLRTLGPVFNNQNTGHSAEFVGSCIGSKAYWGGLVGDIK